MNQRRNNELKEELWRHSTRVQSDKRVTDSEVLKIWGLTELENEN